MARTGLLGERCALEAVGTGGGPFVCTALFARLPAPALVVGAGADVIGKPFESKDGYWDVELGAAEYTVVKLCPLEGAGGSEEPDEAKDEASEGGVDEATGDVDCMKSV